MEQKPHLKILIIGKTGAGKTTAINMLLNLAIGNNYEDERIVGITQHFSFNDQKFELKCNVDEFAIKQSDIGTSSAKSQTKDCNMYSVEADKFSLTLIDTPGLGDTEGAEEDQKHIKTIITRVQELTEINAILYVHKAQDNKKDLLVQYYISQCMGMLTKECKKNFIVCFTNVVNPMKIDGLQVLKDMKIPIDHYYFFENDCLIPISYFNNQDPKKIKQLQRQNIGFWESNAEQFQELIETVLKMQPQKTQDLLDLLVKKESMIKIACEKQYQIKHIEQEKVNIQQTQNNIQRVQKEIQKLGPESNQMPRTGYKEVKLTRKKMRTINLKEKVTFCHNCLSKCHNPCNLDQIYQRGSIQMKQCAAFNGYDNCKVCSHSVDYHGHTNEISEEYDEEYIKEEPYIYYEQVKDLDTIKRKEILKQEQEVHEKKIKDLQQQINNLNQNMETELKLIAILNHKIQEVSMGFSDEITVKYLEEQIKQLDKDVDIDTEQKKRLLQNYQNAKDTYIAIKNQIDKAMYQNKNLLIDKNLEINLNKKLEQTKEQIMQSAKKSIQQAQQSRQSIQNKTAPVETQKKKKYYLF